MRARLLAAASLLSHPPPTHPPLSLSLSLSPQVKCLLTNKVPAVGLARLSVPHLFARKLAAQVATIHSMMALLLPAGSSWLMGLQAAVFASLRLPYFKHDTYYNNEAGERSYLVSAACAILTCWLPKPDRATRRPADFLHILHRQAAEGVATITDTGLDGVMAPAPGSLIIETGKEKDRKHVSPASAAKSAAIRDAFVSAPAFRPDDVESDDEEALLREAVLDNAHVEDEDNAHSRRR